MPKNSLKKKSVLSQKINDLDALGRKWIGYDGLLNMETFALVAILFSPFCFLLFYYSTKCAFCQALFAGL